MRRLLVLVALVCVVAAALASTHRTGEARPAVARAAAPPLTVDTKLPAWRAPGVPVVIGGFAGVHERVTLGVDGRTVASTAAGRLGRYRLHFAAATAGRHRLVVAANGRSRRVGTLVVRPVVVEAVGDITFGEQVGPAISELRRRLSLGLHRADAPRARTSQPATSRRRCPRAALPRSKEFTFRGSPAALPPLHTRAGFDVLTLANNHAVDFGRDALLDTIRYVRAAGMQSIGAGANERRARRPAIVERGGLKVAFLGYSDVNPAGFIATADEPGTAAADVAAITADVHAALRRADVAVCFFHWGTELHPRPDAPPAALRLGVPERRREAHPRRASACARSAEPSDASTRSSRGRSATSCSRRAVSPAHTAILRVALDTKGVRAYRLLPVTIDGFRPRLRS